MPEKKSPKKPAKPAAPPAPGKRLPSDSEHEPAPSKRGKKGKGEEE